MKFRSDPQAIQYLKEVANFRLGQTLDEVRSQPTILSGIAQPSSFVQAICVKYIPLKSITGNYAKPVVDENADENENEDDVNNIDIDKIDEISYFMTFKIYYNTTFDDLKQAACQFWSEKVDGKDDEGTLL